MKDLIRADVLRTMQESFEKGDIRAEIHRDLQPERPERLRFTRKAFRMLPQMDHPMILDVGCGRGDVTLALAKWSNGEVVGLDIDQVALDALSRRSKDAGLAGRIRVLNRSMREMRFVVESFDIIWSEGSIHVVGFEKGLEEWRRLLKPGGYLVVHDMSWLQPDPPKEIVDHWHKLYPGMRTPAEYTEQIPRYGYELIGSFALPEDVWWHDYYEPLARRIRELRVKHEGERQSARVLDEQQREVELYKKYSKWYGSAFFVMRKV